MSTSTLPIFATSRLYLRALTMDDVEALVILRSDESVNRYIERAKSTNAEEVQDFIEKRNADIREGKTFYWAISLKEQTGLIGTICLFNFTEERDKAEIGFELSPSMQGKGLMQEAVETVINYCFKELNLKTLEAWAKPENESSVKLLKKNGFEPVPVNPEIASGNFSVYQLQREG